MSGYYKPRVKSIVLRVGGKVAHVDPQEARRLMRDLANLFGEKIEPR